MKYLAVLRLLLAVIITTAAAFQSTRAGGIIVFEPIQEPGTYQEYLKTNKKLSQMVKDYKTYVTKHLGCKIRHQYDTVYYGLAFEFTSFKKVRNAMVNLFADKKLLLPSTREQMQALFENYRMKELKDNKIRLTFEQDGPVAINYDK